MSDAVRTFLAAVSLAASLWLTPVAVAATALPAVASQAVRATAANYWGDGVWEAYKAHFLAADGRIVDDGNMGISHSEGQGYGMLLATFASDRAAFEKIWAFASRQLYVRKDGLASWKWVPDAAPHVPDPNNATDGDLLIAWALVEAGTRWNDSTFTQSGRQIALAIGRNAVGSSSFGPILRPGAEGFGVLDSDDGPVINLSYWVFPAFEALRKVVPEVNWLEFRASGLALLNASRTGPAQLPPDWTSLRQIKPQPAQKFPPVFGYNAIRIPLYLAWAGLVDGGRLAAFAASWHDPASAPSLIDLPSGKPAEPFGGQGYAAIAALTQCAVSGQPFPPGLRDVKPDKYYPTTLQMLSLVIAYQRFSKCL